jgi:polysaccharide biosynthesis protein PslH
MNIPVVYGTHNSQAVLVYQTPAATRKEKIMAVFSYLTNRLHELYYFRKANALITVSENDKKYHSHCIHSNKIYTVPNFLIESDYIIGSQHKENYILMTANFHTFQNAVGLEWFINEVWNKELWDRTKLLVVGIGSKELEGKIRERCNLTNVEIIGEVDNLKPYIAQATASVVPLLHGSGTRLKCLESMALGTQLVSTSKGAEGIEHEGSIKIADTPAEFRYELLKILDGKSDTTVKARDVFLHKYSITGNKEKFAEIFTKITHHDN